MVFIKTLTAPALEVLSLELVPLLLRGIDWPALDAFLCSVIRFPLATAEKYNGHLISARTPSTASVVKFQDIGFPPSSSKISKSPERCVASSWTE
jgi:hypothetical protein